MSIAQTIRERRSIRAFNRTPVPQDLVLQLLNDAVWAPNHGLREPWRFIYVGSAEGREKLAALTLEASGFIRSPVFRSGLGVREGERIVGILHMGFFDKIPKPKTRTPAEAKLVVW